MRSWLTEFPALGSDTLSTMRRAIDGGFREFTRSYGEPLERAFDPLRDFLLFSERLLTQSPWPLVVGAIALIAWLASRSVKIVIGTVLTLLAIGYFGMWDDTMKTVAMIFVCTVVALAVGLPIGILMSRWDRLQKIVNPSLDVMQTMPSFVYLIPVVMLLRVGDVSAMIAIVAFAVTPVIRYTMAAFETVPPALTEAGTVMGCTSGQMLRHVQLPVALPTILLGINQCFLFSLAMVVITALVGTRDLGQKVYIALTRADVGSGLVAGLCLGLVGILVDRLFRAAAARIAPQEPDSHA